MKVKFIFLLLLVLLAFISFITNAQTNTAAVTEMNAAITFQEDDTTEKPKYHLNLEIYASMSNTYNRGNLDDWWAYRTSDPNRQVDGGSPSFFAVDAILLFPSRKNSIQWGVGIGFIKPAPHSLWGSQIVYGGRQEIVLSPQILSFTVPFKYPMENIENLYLTLTPAFLMGWVTGKYTSSSTNIVFDAAPAPGFSISGGAEFFFNNFIGASFKLGYRMLLKPLPSWRDSSSDTGWKGYKINNEDVKADLSGSYMLVGIVLRLPF